MEFTNFYICILNLHNLEHPSVYSSSFSSDITTNCRVFHFVAALTFASCRPDGTVEKLVGTLLYGGHNLPILVGIGLR